MIKKILRIIEKIKCKISCCYQSKCSLNDLNNLDANSINEIIEDCEEFKPK